MRGNHKFYYAGWINPVNVGAKRGRTTFLDILPVSAVPLVVAAHFLEERAETPLGLLLSPACLQSV